MAYCSGSDEENKIQYALVEGSEVQSGIATLNIFCKLQLYKQSLYTYITRIISI